ncbi:hypothetical protein [Methylobacterium sp. 77]|uniref:hypothetical protein n=1 Tax=Methylobacterium sp. 77 TaxID=1101192 RepID=UPI0003748762|nr:hypothetical protein [Methylobacterium sp. 77]
MAVQNHRFSAIVSSIGILALGATLFANPASAEDATPAPAGRTWTDPPERKAAPSPVVGREETKPQEVRKADVAASGGQGPRIRRDVAGRTRSATANRQAIRKVSSPKIARRVVPADRQGIRAVAVRPPVARIARAQSWTVRAYQPSYVEASGFRYGYTSDEIPVYRRRDEGFTDYRAARLRQAREAGYLVVRAGDLNSLRGRSFETIREPEDRDDPEE